MTRSCASCARKAAVGLLWNLLDDRVPWVAGVADLIAAEDRHTTLAQAMAPPWSGVAGLDDPVSLVIEHQQPADADVLVANIASRSPVILTPEAERTDLLERVRAGAGPALRDPAHLRLCGTRPARRRSEPTPSSKVPGTAQVASWKMMPSVVRSPECTVDTPWRIATRWRRGRRDRAVAREEQERALARRHDVCAGLRARALLDEDELAPREVLPGPVEHGQRLQWEDDLAVDVLMQRVVATGAVAQDQRRRAGWPAAWQRSRNDSRSAGNAAGPPSRAPSRWRPRPAAGRARRAARR